MNICRVGMTSFGNSPYYESIKRGDFTYNSGSGDLNYKADAIYSMLDVVRDEQYEQARMIMQNQLELLKKLHHHHYDTCRYAGDNKKCKNFMSTEGAKYRIQTLP